MRRALLAAVAGAALLAALPGAGPVSAQGTDASSDVSTVTCTAVVTNTRVISEIRIGDLVTERLIEQTVVDRCTRLGGTADENPRRVRVWQAAA